MGYKKCPNGHYYKDNLTTCPYCASSSKSTNSHVGTVPYEQSFNAQANAKATDPATSDPTVAATVGGGISHFGGTGSFKGSVGNSSKTVVLEPVAGPDGQAAAKTRPFRKLVGWLVSYTLDNMGVDFKLYEGRNMIGRDNDCAVCIQDQSVTAKHALILYRAGKYTITDQQSSNGTFVNDQDIDLEPYPLKDGDNIKVGQTVFKFRSSF